MKKSATSDQLSLEYEEVKIPAVQFSKRIKKIGRIEHLIKPEEVVLPTSSEEILISKRRKERLFVLPTKERIIITNKKSHLVSEKADAILSINSTAKWLYHKKLLEVKKLLSNDNLSALRDLVNSSWVNQFSFNREIRKADGSILLPGLRLPQIGALHAISSYWTLNSEPANVIMPTGTGKTETMISTLVLEQCKCLLVIVPSIALRNQTAEKFITLGILKKTKNIGESARYPVVGILEHRPKTPADLKIFDYCNVVIAVINTLSQGSALELAPLIAEKCSHLIIDEAHHIPASTWTQFRDCFKNKPIIQFTATPYREDGSPITGAVVYNYPLRKAQEERLFCSIKFRGVFETNKDNADETIANVAIQCLKEDLAKNYEHVLMARCNNKSRAEKIYKLYQRLAPEYNPVLVISGDNDVESKITSLKQGNSRIVVCVNMLSEGFDLPELKIAAMHDKFKSLAITLQFTGRITRTSSKNIGNATMIANTGLEEVATSIQKLYDEDPDWDKLIADLSFQKIEEQRQLLQFLQKAERVEGDKKGKNSKLTPLSLIPRFNAVVYHCDQFHPYNFHKGIEDEHQFEIGWINKNPDVVFFVTFLEENLKWCKNKTYSDNIWNIFSAYFNPENRLLFIQSSFNSNDLHNKLAQAISNNTARRIEGEDVFRVLGHINRLFLQQVGLLQVGPRNLRYSMFTGRDVKQALSDIISGQSRKSNIFGHGFEEGGPVGIGCSQKGKIWGQEQGPLLDWTDWCNRIGNKLLDETIRVEDLISNVLVPKEIEVLPETSILFIDWPDQIYQYPEDRVTLSLGNNEVPFQVVEIIFLEKTADMKGLRFAIQSEEIQTIFLLVIGKQYENGYSILQETGPRIRLNVGNKEHSLLDYLTNYPPVIFFTDQSELQGNLFTESREPVHQFPESQIYPMEWSGVNIRHESRWSKGVQYNDSIQTWVMDKCREEGFHIIFDDDGSNEIADIVCLKEDDHGITLRMVHCKYSLKNEPSGRIKDIAEVVSQVTKNVRWFWNFPRLIKRMTSRENNRITGRPSRFYVGNLNTLRYFARLYQVKGRIKKEIIIAQPGISAKKITPEIISVLGAADMYTKSTVEIPINFWCNL